jgi:hypothetical protein
MFVMRSPIESNRSKAIRDLIVPSMMEPIFADTSDPPVHRPLRLIAQYLLDNPDLIRPEMAPHICAIPQQFVADHPRPEPDNAAIAGAVDQLVLLNGSRTIADQAREVDAQELARARREVAEALELEFGAVKKAHHRYGKFRAERRRRKA